MVDENGTRWRPCGVGFLDFTFPHARVQMDCNANAGAPVQPNSKESLAMGALHQSRAPPSGFGAGEGGGLRTRRGVSVLVVSRQRVACMCAHCVACLCVGVLVCVCQRLEVTLFRAVQTLFRTTRVEQGCAELWGTASLGYFSVPWHGMVAARAPAVPCFLPTHCNSMVYSPLCWCVVARSLLWRAGASPAAMVFFWA